MVTLLAAFGTTLSDQLPARFQLELMAPVQMKTGAAFQFASTASPSTVTRLAWKAGSGLSIVTVSAPSPMDWSSSCRNVVLDAVESNSKVVRLWLPPARAIASWNVLLGIPMKRTAVSDAESVAPSPINHCTFWNVVRFVTSAPFVRSVRNVDCDCIAREMPVVAIRRPLAKISESTKRTTPPSSCASCRSWKCEPAAEPSGLLKVRSWSWPPLKRVRCVPLAWKAVAAPTCSKSPRMISVPSLSAPAGVEPPNEARPLISTVDVAWSIRSAPELIVRNAPVVLSVKPFT